MFINMRNWLLFPTAIFVLFLFPKSTAAQTAYNPYLLKQPIEKKVVCSHGAVVSAHPLASNVGLSILKKGGNAFDAAIATQLALAVVYPGAGNIGGGGFMVGRKSKRQLVGIDYRA